MMGDYDFEEGDLNTATLISFLIREKLKIIYAIFHLYTIGSYF
jgi:hypothetical protein